MSRDFPDFRGKPRLRTVSIPCLRIKAPVIYWFRRDLRIADNPVVDGRGGNRHAGDSCVFHQRLEEVPSTGPGPTVSIFSAAAWPRWRKIWTPSAGRLIVRQGGSQSRAEGADPRDRRCGVHFNADPDPFGKRHGGTGPKHVCGAGGWMPRAMPMLSLHGPDEVLTQSGQPYRVYTPYSRNWLALDKPAPLPKPPNLCARRRKSPPCPCQPWRLWDCPVPQTRMPEPGERAARERLKQAVAGKIQSYAAKRDLPAENGTSRISQDLRFGLISIRTVYAEAMKARASANAAGRAGIDTFIKELAWREFYFAILHHFPNVLGRGIQRRLARPAMGRTRTAFRRLETRPHRISHRRCRHARAARHRIHAQPRADDHRDVSHQRPAHRLETRRIPLHAAPCGRRDRLQQWRLAMVGRHRCGCGSVFPHPESLVANRAIRFRWRLYQTLGPRTRRSSSIAFHGAAQRRQTHRAPAIPCPAWITKPSAKGPWRFSNATAKVRLASDAETDQSSAACLAISRKAGPS